MSTPYLYFACSFGSKELYFGNEKVQSCGRWWGGNLAAGIYTPTLTIQPVKLLHWLTVPKTRRRAFADRYGIETVFDTLDELLAREVPDIVSAILPTSHNPDAVIACAEAGVKVVSCEKPIAVELSQADAMVRICHERGNVFGCGSVYTGIPYLLETIDWIGAGNIGKLTAAAIPSGCHGRCSGGGCVQLTLLRTLTGMEVEWVEGGRYRLNRLDAARRSSSSEIDCPAYGRLGCLAVLFVRFLCHRPNGVVPARSRLRGENGQVWMTTSGPVFIQGSGAASAPVYRRFLIHLHLTTSLHGALSG